jgi:hypothetical protein
MNKANLSAGLGVVPSVCDAEAGDEHAVEVEAREDASSDPGSRPPPSDKHGLVSRIRSALRDSAAGRWGTRQNFTVAPKV